MSFKIARFLPIALVSTLMLFAVSGALQHAFAAGASGTWGETTQAPTGSVQSPAGNVQSPSGNVQNPGSLVNPLESTSIIDFLLKIVDIILEFALPLIVLYIMYAGFRLVTARGDTGQISEAKTALTWAVIGGVIVLGARLIIDVIKGTVDAL